MRRVRGPIFPLFRHPLAPLSRTGRVVVCVLFALWAFAMIGGLVAGPCRRRAGARRPRARTSRSPATTRRSTALPLKSTQVDVRIAGVIADVTVTQRYRNEGQRPIEARYVFPGSTQRRGARDDRCAWASAC